MIEISSLQHFVAVAQTGSFTRAAEEAGSSQSVISRSVQRLEDQVGTRLIARTTRSVTLTPAGAAMLADALVILSRLAIAADNARRIGSGSLAEIRIGVCPSAESAELARGIMNFRKMWPDLKIQVQAIMGNEQPAALRSSSIDVGILQGGEMYFEDLELRVLANFGLVVAVPTIWGISPQKSIRLVELRDRPWLMPGHRIAGPVHDAFMEQCRSAGFEPNVVGIADDPVSARIMIACGMGAAFFHDKGWHDDRGAITILRFEDRQTVPPAQTVVAWPVGSDAPQILDFVEHMTRAVGESTGCGSRQGDAQESSLGLVSG